MKHLTLAGLNTFDAVATAIGIWLGLLVEANPLLAWLPAIGILAVKLSLINYFVLVLYNTRTNRLSHIGTWTCLFVYGHIFLLHVQWIGAVI
jgi:hypothetical protein